MKRSESGGAEGRCGGERRKEPRFEVNLRCWLERERQTLFGTAINLSNGGMFLRTLPMVETGSAVELKLDIDEGVVHARGRIAWANEPPPGETPSSQGSPGLGIVFTEVLAGQDLLRRFLRARSVVLDT